MDSIYDALDIFNNASKIAFTQNDFELEARCEAEIGKLYNLALKKESKAMTHFNNVVRLAMALRPKDVTNNAWYREVQTTKEAI